MLKRARELYECSSISDKLKKELESAFPELKESEDEKIIRTLKEIVNWGCAKNISVENNVELKDCLAWLEKQGERKTEIEYIYPKFRIGDVIEPIKPNGSYTPVRVLSIEKTTKSYYCESDDKKHFSSIPIRCEYEYKLVEQKPDDKAEPKFKAGDWIVYSRNDSSMEILYVYDIRDGRYYFNDNVHLSWSVKECDEKCHLWTIQDAKDGDVLSTENPFIFSGFGDGKHPNNPTAYCGINTSNTFILSEGNDWWTSGAVHPATEEQRSLLFQKMKEAGYEWDSEKKELKKIDENSDMVKALRTEYEKGRADAISEMKKYTWSEEDESMLTRCIGILGKCYMKELPNKVEEELIWLKSIKSKIQPNQYDKGYEDGYSAAKYNQWKPTDKQMEDFLTLLDYNIGVFDNAKFMSVNSLYDDLKKNLFD